MEFESGLAPDMTPQLDEFVMARIAEDKRIAARAADEDGLGAARAGSLPGGAPSRPGSGSAAATALHSAAAEHVARFGPARVLDECAAKRWMVQACRDARPDTAFLGARPGGLPDFPLTPADVHQLAALTLALLALPYAGHPDYRQEWRP
ncbi:DUF6221 family protein [Geodermatophilus sp. URMC 63]